MYRNGYQVNPDISLLGFKESNQMYDIYNNDPETCTNSSDICIIKTQKQFSQIEESSSEIMYRCMKCLACKTCKDHDQIKMPGIKDKVEQDMMNQSVHVNPK